MIVLLLLLLVMGIVVSTIKFSSRLLLCGSSIVLQIHARHIEQVISVSNKFIVSEQVVVISCVIICAVIRAYLDYL